MQNVIETQQPSKTVRLGGAAYDLRGISESDPYVSGIRDGFDDDFAGFCRSHLRPDHQCVDVGANIGITALIMAERVPDGRVLAIEAAPKVAAVLRDNVSGKQNITVIESAIGDRDGTVAFDDNSAWGHVSDSGVQVPMRRLQTVLHDNGMDRVDFIKLDVEGYESVILRDALPIIQRDNTLVYFEINAFAAIAHAAVNYHEFAGWLLATFPAVHAVRRGGGLKRMTSIVDIVHTNIVEDRAVSDFVLRSVAET